MSDLYRLALDLLTNPKHTRWIAPLLILAEAALCALIILYIPYTEIDYTTYMVQIHKFVRGERNYSKLTGPTGPLVYPAVHVALYTVLYFATTTRDVLNGEIAHINIARAQIIFAGLYLVTLAVVIACYRRVNAPPWLLVPLVLSKRLHSIFVLRLFNDAWATLFFWLAVYSLQRKHLSVAAGIWSFGVGIKMTVLLAAPALGFILLQGMELADATFMGVATVATQILIATPFIERRTGGDFWAYFERAFEFTRAFLFKWTVNWRFVGEERFLSKEFAVGLLILHASILITFAHTKWVQPSASGLQNFVRKLFQDTSLAEMDRIAKRLTPEVVTDAMLGCLVIGLLCARSLHYQFYAYLGWATPYLVWRGTGSMAITLTICAAQEWAWLVFPSTDVSSAVVVGCLALQVVSALITPPAHEIVSPPIPDVKPAKKTDVPQSDVKSE